MDYENSFKDSFIETKHGRIHYRRHKSDTGKSLVLVHGMASSTLTWKRLVGKFPESLDICMIDLLGHGSSDSPEIDYKVGIQTEILKEVFNAEKIRSPYLMGHSYGGWVCAEFARKNPVRGLILEDSGGLKVFYEEIKGDKNREDYKKKMLEKVLELDAKKHVMENILNDQFREGELDEKTLGEIKIPSLIIWGGEDKIISIRYALLFSELLPNSRLEIIKNARHTPHYSNPDDVSEIILEFMKEHP